MVIVIMRGMMMMICSNDCYVGDIGDVGDDDDGG